MAPIRLRHPAGVATIQVPLDDPDYTVLDLQQEIYKLTDILPSRQTLRSGYPPRPLTLIPELSLSSLDLKGGEQIIVQGNAEPSVRGVAASPPRAVSTRAKPDTTPTQPAQQSAPAPSPQRKSSDGPDSVEVDGGYLIHRVVPDDNSCLFSSLALIFEGSITHAQNLRKAVVEGINADWDTWNEAILGMPRSRYIETISKTSSWGGAIELSILAKHYNTEIASIDVETGRIDRFSPGEQDESAAPGERNQCLVIYSGIHYDAISFSPMENAPDEWHQKLFPIKPEATDPIIQAAKKLADILRSKKAFTNTATFDLKCEQCGQGLKGEKDARAHAEQTGHVRFGEY
ncbi:OTU-domain-containing protein [Coprinopsis marcescibilis]|uniref:Ubiquitin thioesterase OTU n=1 Tax=Coprinopsis marcescibilis TaxID=230819 RepID=A0A5C3LDU8_COPMA|nr:OTU-domain-containing protein [Coprinopsis marcescibilis]